MKDFHFVRNTGNHPLRLRVFAPDHSELELRFRPCWKTVFDCDNELLEFED